MCVRVSVRVMFACGCGCVRECGVRCGVMYCLVPAALSLPLSSRIAVITVLNS